MAILHRAELVPSKLELLSEWLPTQPWATSAADLEQLGAFRFDDPDGEVGMETHLVRAGDGRTFQVPLTYRAGPLEGGETYSIGTMQHSVLGERWVYDAIGDPIYLAALAHTILTGGSQAEQHRVVDGRREDVPATAQVKGSGSRDAEVVPVDLEVVRVVTHDAASDDHTLTGTWRGVTEPALLAVARVR